MEKSKSKPKKSGKSKKIVKTWVCPRCKHKQKRRGTKEHSIRCTQCGKFEFAKKYPDARLRKNQSEIQSRVRDEKLKNRKKPKKTKKPLKYAGHIIGEEYPDDAKDKQELDRVMEQPDYSQVEQTQPI